MGQWCNGNMTASKPVDERSNRSWPASLTRKKRKEGKKMTNVHITMVLDRSGSMGTIRDATIDGVNEYINKQKMEPFPATFSLYQFDDKFDTVFNRTDIKNVPTLNTDTFVPRGMTALNDAIGRAIALTAASISKSHCASCHQDVPQKILFVIVTDGGENASQEYTLQRLAELKKEKEAKGWDFVFIGANIDAFAVGSQYGFKRSSTLQFDSNPESVSKTYANLSQSSTSYRSSAAAGKPVNSFFKNEHADDLEEK